MSFLRSPLLMALVLLAIIAISPSSSSAVALKSTSQSTSSTLNLLRAPDDDGAEDVVGKNGVVKHEGNEVCRGSCDSCIVDSDCTENHFCYTTISTGDSFCKSRVFFSHMNWRHAVAPLFIFLTAAIAAGSGGTGAGTVNVPVLLMVQALTPGEAVSTSQAAIIGGSIAGMFMYGPRSHPNDPQRSIFEVDVVLLLLPTMLAGTMFGILFHVASPYWFVFLLLILISLWGVWKTITKARALWKRETELQQAEAKLVEKQGLLEDAEEKSSHASGGGNATSAQASSNQGELQFAHMYTSLPPPSHTDAEVASVEPSKEFVKPISQGLVWKLVSVTLLFIVVAVLNLLRGGKPGETSVAGIQFCSTEFWVFTMLEAPLLIGLSALVGVYLIRVYKKNLALNRIREDVDLVWTPSRVIWYPVMSFVAGIFASMIGFGGGLLLSPIMLDLNMPPESVAATASLIHLMSSSAAVFNYSVAGMVLWQHALVFGFVALLGQFVGQTVVDYFVRKYRRPSIIAVMICVMVVLASVMLIASGAIQVTSDFKTHRHLKFRSFCASK